MTTVMNNLAILGISEKEQLTYQTILQTCIVNARELSDILSIKRTTVYLYLEQLKQKGFVFEITNQKKKYFQAVNPRGLKQVVKSKITELEKLEKDIPNLIQQFQTTKQPRKRSATKLYKGIVGMQELVEEGANAKGEVCFLGSIKALQNYLSFELLEKIYTQPRRRNMNIDYLISDWAESTVRRFYEERQLFSKTRFLPPELEPKGAFVIFNNKLIVAQFFPEPHGIVIEEPTLISMFKLAFMSFWKDLEGKNLPPNPLGNE